MTDPSASSSPSTTPPYSLQLTPLSTLQPPSSSRTWQTKPHPSLPLVATACSDHTVRIYSLTSFTLVQTLSGAHKRSVRTVSWKPNTRGESVLATGSFDSSAAIWRRQEGVGRGEEDFTSRGVRSGNDEDDDDEEEDDGFDFTTILDGHESELKSLSWSPSGHLLATCSRDKSVWIWEEVDEENYETVAVLQEHDADVKCVAWHPEEELLVSSSYDDWVKFYREDGDDWVGVGGIESEGGTVWWVEFEGSGMKERDFRKAREGLSEGREEWIAMLERSGPRLATSSDDGGVRIYRRKPSERSGNAAASTGIPSIIRSFSIDEEWVLDAVLPKRHDRPVYSVSWSKRTGMIVSAGSDGKIVVYKERWREAKKQQSHEAETKAESDVQADGEQVTTEAGKKPDTPTEWSVVAELYSAHDVFEINHVVWAHRRDKDCRSEDEEVIISTGDDGEVKVWTLDEVVKA
ncbi:cytosolic iron-sulfur protein assembly protein 1 [Westerdykella ornata]|uniref:Probable cytosolic iron-sulfur protein assembly protein 1 n=1 Tax=Westerdykella ornata TaxID=318751 RepID=A0A6A6JFD3_WESOR|nr:cytosolic iron-sulfur protein assembly protein 1 [Westerdykella ornata]KAF2275122.1 cytosolic iron-sulfur protein assembly protein 1 [Westerdykella ornata]